jgi:serine/threonine-protein kinase
MKAIRRDPEKRYHSVRDMLHDLQHLQDVKPVHYAPEKPQASNWVQQVKWAALIIICLSLLVIALGILAQFAHHAAH